MEKAFVKQYSSKDGRSIIVREANEEDGKLIESLVNSVASEKRFIVPERSRKDWDEAIKEIKSRKSLIIVAQIDGKIVGMAHLVRGKFEKNGHVGSLGISILKGFRRMGIGTAMMEYIIDWANQQDGLEKISLTVFSTNKGAIDLYHKSGFMIEGVSKKQYKIEGKYIDDMIMAKFLN